ncbi:glycan-binding surface protein [Hymenobacter sp. GOD-10R]|uniref:glycan-binding surface protein n=1 Tax=Hymenobacter sp. GOD-10R TaxID=3093922 RepID=UPI002D78E3AE|nr:glycan-binding surface protein [Hymenobacter sp. GOD-10R]WRQ31089.1 glycan-binding surface protein [Hymenobacter sp. GOD-10R]
MLHYTEKSSHRLLIWLLLLLAFTQTACDKDDENEPPTITTIRAYLASPADSVLSRVGPGAWIVIQGSGFKSTKQVFFDGIQATFNPALLADRNLVVQIPEGIPFATVPTDQMNSIRVVTEGGETTFQFPIQAPPPVITAASNEFAYPGETITLSGTYLYLIDKITFPGNVNATEFTATDDGTTVRVKVPANVRQGGSIMVKTQFGTAISPFGFNSPTGMLLNFDDVGSNLWGSTVTNSTTLYPGGHGNYASMVQDLVPANNWDWFNGKRAINSPPGEWVPASELGQPAGNYALKFEIFVKEPWSTGALLVTPSDAWVYIARYEPWKTTPNFKTTGWMTVTLPLSTFKLKDPTLGDGNGKAAVTVRDIIGSTDEFVRMMFVNDTATPLAKLDLAIDNIRVVKIK